MKVWILEHDSYGEVFVYHEDTNPLDIPMVKDELEDLVGAYDDEREEFIESIKNGRGEIEERFSLELVTVKEL